MAPQQSKAGSNSRKKVTGQVASGKTRKISYRNHVISIQINPQKKGPPMT
jgi:hypothetical protein